jgi:virulence-associated protein VagC
MATNFMDKGLYQAPQGLEQEEAEPIEIEIVDPEEVSIHAGGLDLTITPKEPSAEDFNANLAEYMDAGKMQALASELDSDIQNDRSSRKDWEQTYVDGLKLLGLKYEERTEPWNGACGVFHPMITEAVVRFQSEMITETFPAAGPVKAKIIGKETPAKKASATRVVDDMNYQLTERMQEFRPEHERMLWNLPAAGSAFKKVYFDPSLDRQSSIFIPAEDILLPYGVTDARSSYRVTHVMRKTKNEILKLQQAGFYCETEIGEPEHTKDDIQKAKDSETGFSDINDERFVLYECCVDLDLPGFEDEEGGEPTGIALPYVITLIRGTNTVLAIRRNWKEEDELKLKRQHFVQYNYIPGFGPYGFGLFHLIGGFAKSATSIMRQLVDAGTLSNLPGGLKSRGLRIKGDDTPIAPGEWRDVDVGSGAMRDSILPLPYKEPSGTLYNLLNTIVEEGRRFAATADMQVSDMSAQAPVGTTLALLERQLKVMTAVQARVHYALKQELGLIKDIIADYADEDYSYEPETGRQSARKEDFKHVDIIPVSDPNASTLAQRVVQYQAVIQLAQSAPQIYDLPQLHRGMLEVLGIKNPEKLVALPDDQKPVDPVTENMFVLKGKPLKAFIHQDHEAHIKVHTAAMQDPLIMQLIGQNPQAQAMMAAMQAHIAEHVGYGYRQKIEQQLGMALPPEDEKLPPEVEIAMSGMMAQAAQQVLQQNQAMAAQQQAQQQAQDPVLQMQQQELQLRSRELDIKEKQMQVNAAAESDRIDIEREKMENTSELNMLKISKDVEHKQQSRQDQQQREGVRMGIDIAKSKQQAAMQARQAAMQSQQKKPNKE